MANTVTSLFQNTQGTALTPAGQYAQGPGDAQQPAFTAIGTFLSDGATTGVLTVNWIDGTATLPFLPTMVRAHVIPVSGGATAGALAADNGGLLGATARISAVTTTSFGLNIATAFTGGSLVFKVLFEVFK